MVSIQENVRMALAVYAVECELSIVQRMERDNYWVPAKREN